MTRVAVIGAGYVGLVTGACLAKIGHQVICVDRDSERIEQIRRGTVPFHEPGLDALLAEVLGSGLFSASTDLAPAVGQSGVSMIAVGTPSTNGVIDLGAVQASCREIGEALGPRGDYHVVVVKSTVVPGTTDTVVAAEVMGASGRSEDSLGICMNPEFLREGSAVEDVMHPDRIVIGARSSRAHDVVAGLYRSFDCPLLATNPSNAEMIKYTSNVLLATLISFSNEIAAICEGRPELDETMVMKGVHLDRRLTPLPGQGAIAPGVLSYLRAGIGYGGSCLPKDLAALRSHAQAAGVETPLLDAVAEVNAQRPGRIVALLGQMLGGLQGKVVTVLGLAFKPDTDDVRDSPSFALIDALRAGGASVR
ncbi:MAG: UDP-glucose/GDP-mannose dehydrogenase family protein, partial [Alphaproteobacteria bacterium]|nr:UDP-glucose/GDP-mannose dehydrogenase family protein [Alphaproteobacteria bacterium]